MMVMVELMLVAVIVSVLERGLFLVTTADLLAGARFCLVIIMHYLQPSQRMYELTTYLEDRFAKGIAFLNIACTMSCVL